MPEVSGQSPAQGYVARNGGIHSFKRHCCGWHDVWHGGPANVEKRGQLILTAVVKEFDRATGSVKKIARPTRLARARSPKGVRWDPCCGPSRCTRLIGSGARYTVKYCLGRSRQSINSRNSKNCYLDLQWIWWNSVRTLSVYTLGFSPYDSEFVYKLLYETIHI